MEWQSNDCYSVATAMYAHATQVNPLSQQKQYRIWENPPYGIRASSSGRNLSKVQILSYYIMSNNPFSNCCHLLRRLVVLYEGEISLHFDPPSRHSRRTWSPLLWALIRILCLDTARFIELLYVCSPFLLLGHLRTTGCRCQQQNSTLAQSLRSFRTAPPRSI